MTNYDIALSELAQKLVHNIGTCPYDYFETKSGMPCEKDDDACCGQMEECWCTWAKMQARGGVK